MVKKWTQPTSTFQIHFKFQFIRRLNNSKMTFDATTLSSIQKDFVIGYFARWKIT